MSAVHLPAPGTQYGPCVGECAHRDCASLRAHSVAPCQHCGKPIGYDVPYYYGLAGGTGIPDVEHFAHASCAEREAEQ